MKGEAVWGTKAEKAGEGAKGTKAEKAEKGTKSEEAAKGTKAEEAVKGTGSEEAAKRTKAEEYAMGTKGKRQAAKGRVNGLDSLGNRHEMEGETPAGSRSGSVGTVARHRHRQYLKAHNPGPVE